MGKDFDHALRYRHYLDQVAKRVRGEHTSQPAKTAPLPVAPQPMAAARSAQALSMLERKHPDIAQAVTLLWGYPEMNAYFDRLWQGEGDSKPIAPDAMSDLMVLARVHQSLLPTLPASPASEASKRPSTERDIWGNVPPHR